LDKRLIFRINNNEKKIRKNHLQVIMERDKMKTDLMALFLDRLTAMPHEVR
jgi:hypothetical protein